MKITIDNKEFQLVFSYTFVKHVIKKKKLKGFAGYGEYLQGIGAAADGSFGPDELELISELVALSIESIAKKQPKITVEQIAAHFWQNMDQMEEVVQHFIDAQPNVNKDVVDPSHRLGK